MNVKVTRLSAKTKQVRSITERSFTERVLCQGAALEPEVVLVVAVKVATQTLHLAGVALVQVDVDPHLYTPGRRVIIICVVY